MIIKNKEISSSKDIKQIAGDKQEQDVAFFLRRAYKDNHDVFIFNDLRIEFNDEIAQIDHLILYTFGFILVESKSITGEVTINHEQEWSRSYNGKWSGMRSPIKQLELQERLLRELLYENRESMLDKIIFGKLQTTFGGRCWDQFCAISSNAIAHRDEMPKAISKKLVKSEFLVDKLNNLIPNKHYSNILKLTYKPFFSKEEMDKICNFLMIQHKPLAPRKATELTTKRPEVKTAPVPQEQQNPAVATKNEETIKVSAESFSATKINSAAPKLVCKKCAQTEHLQAAWGKFGYYVKCPNCKTNTAMKRSCPNCNSKNTKVNKQKAYYHLTCQDCNACQKIFVEEPRLQVDTNNQPQKQF